MQLDALNVRFAIKDHLEFVAGQGGLTNAVISNDLASATVSLNAGTGVVLAAEGNAARCAVSE